MSEHDREVLTRLVKGLEKFAEELVTSLPLLEETDEYHHFLQSAQAFKEELNALSPNEEIIVELGESLNALIRTVTIDVVLHRARQLAQEDQNHRNEHNLGA